MTVQTSEAMQNYVRNQILKFPNRVNGLKVLTSIAMFNFYRVIYDDLTFEDKKRLYVEWYKAFPEQTFFDCNFVYNAINYITKECGVLLYVAELGGYQGELAQEMLPYFPEVHWTNYEIIPHKTVSILNNYFFEEATLTDEVWLQPLTPYPHVFISMHTCEHFSNTDFILLVDWLINQRVPYLIFQLPVQPEGQTWHNYYGSHVLTFGSNKIKTLLTPYYTLINEVEKGIGVKDGWCSFWKLKQ